MLFLLRFIFPLGFSLKSFFLKRWPEEARQAGAKGVQKKRKTTLCIEVEIFKSYYFFLFCSSKMWVPPVGPQVMRNSVQTFSFSQKKNSYTWPSGPVSIRWPPPCFGKKVKNRIQRFVGFWNLSFQRFKGFTKWT